MNMYAVRSEKTASEKDKTNIPRGMKKGFEHSSGFSFDDVRVHYNSEKPAQLHANAYTQGNNVYVAPGQEKHLPHELGHVVQQKSDMVEPTGKVGGLLLNDDESLENGADRIAEEAEELSDAEDEPVQGKFKDGGIVQRDAATDSSIASAIMGGLGALIGGVGLFQSYRYNKEAEEHRVDDAKQKKIDEIKKYSDAACDAYDELEADHKLVDPGDEMHLQDETEIKKATVDEQKQKARVWRYYQAALRITSEMNGGNIGSMTVDQVLKDPLGAEADIDQLENQEVKEALFRANDVYKQSFTEEERQQKVRQQRRWRETRQNRIRVARAHPHPQLQQQEQ